MFNCETDGPLRLNGTMQSFKLRCEKLITYLTKLSTSVDCLHRKVLINPNKIELCDKFLTSVERLSEVVTHSRKSIKQKYKNELEFYEYDVKTFGLSEVDRRLYRYHSGDNPWDLVLVVNSPEHHVAVRHQIKMWTRENNCSRIERPLHYGEAVMCWLPKSGRYIRGFFAGLVTLSKAKIYDADSTDIYELALSRFYEMTPTISSIPPLYIRCSLPVDSYAASMWQQIHEHYFRTLMQKYRFGITLKETEQTDFPEKLILHSLIGYDDYRDAYNVCKWFNWKIIPAIHENLDDCTVWKIRRNSRMVDLNKYCLNDDSDDSISGNGDQEDWIDESDSECEWPEIHSKFKTSCPKTLPSSPSDMRKKRSRGWEDYANTTSRSSTSLPVPTTAAGSSDCGYALSTGDNSTRPLNTSTNSHPVQSNNATPDMQPVRYNRRRVPRIPPGFENQFRVEDQAEVGRRYNEEIHLCPRFRRIGTCSSTFCTKEHTPVDGTFMGAIYCTSAMVLRLELPPVGHTIIVKPVHIVGPTIFMAHLVIRGYGDSVTLVDLEQRMQNEPEVSRYRNLDTLPSIGELVLAQSAKWFRGRIVSTNDITAEVYDIDYGKTEELPLSSLRQLNRDLAFLPEQAVRCQLHQLELNSFYKDDLVMAMLKELLYLKLLPAKVIIRDEVNQALEIELYDDEGRNINDFLTYSNICSKKSV